MPDTGGNANGPFDAQVADLPRHKQVGIGLLLAQLDSLALFLKNDRVEILVDGTQVLSVGLGPNQGSEPQVNTNSFNVYDLSALEALQAIPHTGNTLTIEFLGIQNSVGENGGFGMDQFQVTVYPLRGTLITVL